MANDESIRIYPLCMVIITLLVISAGQKTNQDTRLDHVFIYVPISSVISGQAHSDIRVGKRRHRTGKRNNPLSSQILSLYSDYRAGFTYRTCKSCIRSHQRNIATDRCSDKKCIVDRDSVVA